jgi:hypothetical protein
MVLKVVLEMPFGTKEKPKTKRPPPPKSTNSKGGVKIIGFIQ